MRSWLLGVILVLWAAPAWAVDDVPAPWQGGTGCESSDTIAGLPTSPLDGTICTVTNGSVAAGDCSTTGTDHIVCYYDSAGAVWRPLARSVAGGTGDISDVGPGCATGACLTDGLATTGAVIFVWEGTTVNANQINFAIAADPGAAYTLTFPSVTGTFCTTGDSSVCPGALSGDVSSSGTVTTIGNDKVLESMLKVVNSPTDEYVLTYESTVGDFEWQSVASSGGGSFLLLDASNDPLTGELTITQGAASTTPSLTVQNTNDNATTTIVRLKGPDRATSANNDAIRLIFAQEDATTTIDDQTEIRSKVTDRSSTLEDSQLEFWAAANGTMTRIALVGSDAGLGGNPIFTVGPDGGQNADVRFNATSLDGAFCWDGGDKGLLHIGTGQSSVTRCNGTGVTHGSITGVNGANNQGIVIESAQDAVLVLEADDANANAGFNPEIHIVQDGDGSEFVIGMEGSAGTKFTNSTANAAYIEAAVTGTHNIELANNNTMRLRVTATEVDVAAGGSTDIAAVGGLMSVNNTAVANVGASGPDNLVTYSIPASTLSVTGDLIVFEADFTFAANGNSKEFRIVYGATPVTVITSGAQAQNGGSCRIRGYISKTGSNTEDISASMTCDNTNLFTYNANFTTATETLTNALDLKGQSVTSTNDGDVQMENLRVWFYPNQS